MNTLSRRSLFTGLPLIAASLLTAGCVTGKVGTTSSILIDVARVNAYVTGAKNAATVTISLLGNVPALAIYITPAKAALAILSDAADAFEKAAGDELILAYNNTTVKSRVDSILVAIKKIADLLKDITVTLTKTGVFDFSDILSKVELMHNALSTVISVFTIILSNQTTVANRLIPDATVIAERSSLKTLGV